MTQKPPSDTRLIDIYLSQAGQVLCLATHSKLGLTSFVTLLQARAETANLRHRPAIIDGGIIALPIHGLPIHGLPFKGLPIEDYLPQMVTAKDPPGTIILLAHQQDSPRLLTKIGRALQDALLGARCFFHFAGEDIDLDLSN